MESLEVEMIVKEQVEADGANSLTEIILKLTAVAVADGANTLTNAIVQE